MGSRLNNTLKVVLGLVVGLAGAEALFRYRDHGAFPHLNTYETDASLGVHLRPGATEKISFNDNPVTTVRINKLGFRGPNPPAAEPGEILVVGDSQVFGLGVEENETFSAQLETSLPGRHVFNAGVPTYGPPEFTEVTWRLLDARHATTVIYVVNLANDLFEAKRPNTQRHAVVDGWAVRRESSPTPVHDFPGRALLFRDSHAAFAYRQWSHRGEADSLFASEGTWQDLLGASATSAAQTKSKADTKSDLERLAGAEINAQLALEANAKPTGIFASPEGHEYVRMHGHPNDITVPNYDYAEESRAPYRTGSVLMTGAQVRQRVEQQLRAFSDASIKNEKLKKVRASLEERAAIEQKIEELRDKLRTMLDALSPLRDPLAAVASVCRERNAELIVVVLPIDVQVSKDEWEKYGKPAIDMQATDVLTDDIRRAGIDLNVPVWSAIDVLRAAEPGAFLKGDIHMTPKGHAAVAEGLAKFIREKRTAAQ